MALDFPTRLAAIDVGSNAIRMLAGEFSDVGNYRVLDLRRLPVRLGHDVFDAGRLSERAMQAAIEGLSKFSRRIQSLSIDRYRAVATSAVRDSRNGPEFIERASVEAGITIEVISGEEEARLVHLAVRNRVHLADAQWILADLGGGSLEVSRIDHERVLFTETYPVGSVRLLEQLGSGFSTDDVRRVVADRTATMQGSVLLSPTKRFIATGGNIEAVARLAGVWPDGRGVFTLSTRHLREVRRQLGSLSYEERMHQLGLREDRADVILPAAIVYEWLADLLGADSVIVPAVGVKEGVLWKLIETVGAAS